jgi:hypothetical protein
MKAVWPETFDWTGSTLEKSASSKDGRIVIAVTQRFAVPEEWKVLIFVYGPNGRADIRQGWFELLLEGNFADVVERAKSTVLASGLID